MTISMSTGLGSVRDPRDLVREYQEKKEAIHELYSDFIDIVEKVEIECTVAGSYGRGRLWNEKPRLYKRDMLDNLLRSAWWAAYDWCNMSILATATDKQKIQQDFEKPVPFTVENLTATFGPYLADQRGAILRGLAEAFIQLDDAYKSHSKVKIGVKGLPKRVIINNVMSDYGSLNTWGWDKMKDMLNALHVYNGHGIISNDIINDIGNKKLLKFHGMEFKWFKNGNVHIHFDHHACLQINRGLAEFYGEVLPDVEVDKSELKPNADKTKVSKDLQFYPTPRKVVDGIISRHGLFGAKAILEPSCGNGAIMDSIMVAAKENYKESLKWGRKEDLKLPEIYGIEYDSNRASLARINGHNVVCANFLEVQPTQKYDMVFMNPPFYGKHYLKHVNHAMKFLGEGGVLICILPATAHYDHKELPSGYRWTDLPVASFAESGTRIPTGYGIWHV